MNEAPRRPVVPPPVSSPPVSSPCVRICQVDRARGLCTGCLRTLAEIAAWPSLDDAARREIVTRLAARR